MVDMPFSIVCRIAAASGSIGNHVACSDICTHSQAISLKRTREIYCKIWMKERDVISEESGKTLER